MEADGDEEEVLEDIHGGRIEGKRRSMGVKRLMMETKANDKGMERL